MRRIGFILAVGFLALAATGCGQKPVAVNANITANTDSSPVNAVNASIPLNTNTETEQAVTLTGKVFVKGYNTPSESFGMLAADGSEIGFEQYDSRREEFRPYIGDDLTVVFYRICQSARGDCCRTLFKYCGTVKSWQPVKK